MFEFGFKLKWKDLTDKFKGHEKKLFDLYEYWSYFKLIEIMEDLCECEVNFEDIFKISDDGLTIELKEGIVKQFNYNDTEIDLLYNYSFKKSNANFFSYSVNLRPDYTIVIHKENMTYFIHFDAKYKMFVDSEDFKNEDIRKMHTYKDAIKNSIGAYIIYPGSKIKIYYEKDDETESVGAFGLTPGEIYNIKNISNFIKNLIDKLVIE